MGRYGTAFYWYNATDRLHWLSSRPGEAEPIGRSPGSKHLALDYLQHLDKRERSQKQDQQGQWTEDTWQPRALVVAAVQAVRKQETTEPLRRCAPTQASIAEDGRPFSTCSDHLQGRLQMPLDATKAKKRSEGRSSTPATWLFDPRHHMQECLSRAKQMNGLDSRMACSAIYLTPCRSGSGFVEGRFLRRMPQTSKVRSLSSGGTALLRFACNSLGYARSKVEVLCEDGGTFQSVPETSCRLLANVQTSTGGLEMTGSSQAGAKRRRGIRTSWSQAATRSGIDRTGS